MQDRVQKRLEQEGVAPDSIRGQQIEADEICKMMDAMTPEERLECRQASELGCLPGDVGGGWDLLYTPDQGAKP